MSLYDPELGEKLTATASQYLNGMVTGMYTIVEFIDDEGNQKVAFTAAPNQKATTSAGLLALSNSISEYELREYVAEMYGHGDD